jgi:CheY-like chemotaxis protein
MSQSRKLIAILDPIAQKSHIYYRRLAAELLNLSKVESGALEIEAKPFSLRNVVKHITDVTHKRLLDTGLAYEVRVDQGIPDKFIGDSNCIHKAITNLLVNATKFTNSGKVSLNIELASKTDSMAVVSIQITDTGTRIPKDKLSSIFSPFEQVDQSNSRQNEGVGLELGLAIVKRTIEGLNGSIKIESALNEGSCFTVQLPLVIDTEKEAQGDLISFSNASKDQDTNNPYHVLIVDDNPANQLLVKTILKLANQNSSEAFSGVEALECIRNHKFDCILMDVGMPYMSGHEATRQIRTFEIENKRPRTPILALTAHSMPEDRKACMNGFLSKPVDREILKDTVLEFCQRNRRNNKVVNSLTEYCIHLEY